MEMSNKTFMLLHLPKTEDGNVSDPNKTRPISVTEFSYKLEEKLIKDD